MTVLLDIALSFLLYVSGNPEVSLFIEDKRFSDILVL